MGGINDTQKKVETLRLTGFAQKPAASHPPAFNLFCTAFNHPWFNICETNDKKNETRKCQ